MKLGTLRWEYDPGPTGWAQSNHKGPYDHTYKRQEDQHQRRCDKRNIGQSDTVAVFKDGGRGREPRNAGGL